MRTEEADLPGPERLRDGDLGRSRLRALTSFVDTAVPALLLLTLMAGEQNSETVPDLKQLATMLNELQEGTEVGRGGPDPSAIGRLYRAVMNLKSGAS